MIVPLYVHIHIQVPNNAVVLIDYPRRIPIRLTLRLQNPLSYFLIMTEMVRRGRRLMNINIHVENMVNTYIYNRTNIQKINLFFGGRHSYEVPRIP